MNVDLKTAVFMFLAALIGYGFSRIGKRQDRRSDKEVSDENEAKAEVIRERQKVRQLEIEVALLKAEAVPINAAYKAMLIAKLTHFHSPKLDGLMAKAGTDKVASTLSEGEKESLAEGLEERSKELDKDVDEAERIAAKILPDVIRLAELEELHKPKVAYETVLVSQPAIEIMRNAEGEEHKEEARESHESSDS